MNHRRPNIVITMADDQRHDLIGALGHPVLRTPALDRLVNEGTCFTRAHCMGSTHGAVCAPSRAMLHTGRTMYHIPGSIRRDFGQFRPPCDTDPASLPLLGELLQSAGYRTFATGKWHNERDSFARSFQEGRNVFLGGMADHFATPVSQFADGSFSDSFPGDGHSTELFTGAAVDFIRGYNDERPFFLLCAFTAPHDPRDTLPRWHAQYRPEDVALPPNFVPEHPFNNGNMDGRDEELAAKPRDPDEIRKHIADYYAITAHMDDGIGRILAAIDERQWAENTIFIHTADHGLSVGQHGLLGKQNLYDHSMRVPLIVRGPGFTPSLRDDRLCYQHDVYPTVLGCAGAAVPDACEFHSLRDRPAYDTLFTAYREIMRAVRDDRHKLIEYLVEGSRHTQLFDLHKDAWEMHDLAADAPDIVARLRSQLAAWQTRVDDPVRAPAPEGAGIFSMTDAPES